MTDWVYKVVIADQAMTAYQWCLDNCDEWATNRAMHGAFEDNGSYANHNHIPFWFNDKAKAALFKLFYG